MSLVQFVRRHLLEPQDLLDDLPAWRERLLSIVLLVVVILGTIVVVPSVLLSLRERMWAIALVDVLALAWVVMLWRRRALGFRARAWSFCALIYLLGFALLFSVGPASQIYLMAFPVMAALLLGLKPAMLALALNAATLLGVGYLANTDLHIPGFEARPFIEWSVITLNFVFINAMLTLSCVVLLQGLDMSLARMRAMNEGLEKRVAERTRELEAFSYSVAHDLRSPLRAINGYSTLVLSDNADRLDAEAVDHLQRVCAASRRMGDLIDDLLQLSKVSRKPLQRQEVDLARIAAQIVSTLRERQPERDVAITLPPELKSRADPYLARILLDNLLENAWKYTGKACPARIEFGCRGINGEAVCFVRDNGAGFDMAYADKLFEPFERLHPSEEYEGTGIGLSIAQRIVSRHEGRIWAESAIGEGATFWFTLGGACRAS